MSACDGAAAPSDRAGGAVNFKLFGPVEFWLAGREVELGAARQRYLLAALLLNRGQPVATEVLVERMWDDSPPTHAREVLYTYVSRLRSTLRVAVEITLTHDARGYHLALPAETVDVYRFERLLGQARAAAGQAGIEARVQHSREALALWRGRPLDGLSGRWIERVREQFESQRLSALVSCMDLELQRGRHAEVLDELAELVLRYPTVEPLTGHLMLALYRCGRPAEALHVFRETRRALVELQGIEAGPDLQRLERAILQNDPALQPPNGSAAGIEPLVVEAKRPRASELPAEPYGFVGRAAELAHLDALSSQGTVAAIVGPAGVGKTALALHWAHASREGFPDGQLYIDLRGFGTEAPYDPTLVVERFLRSLGVRAESIPADPDEGAAMYRSILANRRMLVVLDNAASSRQVRPLLPGAGCSLVLVTSRQRLDGLVATHGAARIALGALTDEDAFVLIGQFDSTATDPEYRTCTERLAILCDRLPLALRIAVARLDRDAGRDVARLVADLEDEGQRLARLTLEDDDVSVRAAVAVSLNTLDPAARRMFRLLGLHAGARPSVAACAVLADLPERETRVLLDRLAAAHLVLPDGPGRCGLHDLVRLFAKERAEAEESPAVRDSALVRTLVWYRDAANTADHVLRPAERRNFVSATDPVAFSATTTALDWLDSEADNLISAVQLACEQHPALAWQIAAAMYGWLFRRGRRCDWIALYENAVAAARSAGDREGEALILSRLAIPYSQLGNTDKAAAACGRAFQLRHDLGDVLGAATALLNLGGVYINANELSEAVACLSRAAELADPLPEAEHLKALIHSNLGQLYQLMRRTVAASEEYHTALRIAESRCGDREVAQIVLNLANLYRSTNDHTAAIRHGELGLARAAQAGDAVLQAEADEEMGRSYAALGDVRRSTQHLRRALEVYESVGHLNTADVRHVLSGLNGLNGRQGNPARG